MGLRYHDGMAVPYEATGRTDQKSRTRQALVAATRELLAEGSTPTVEDAAAARRHLAAPPPTGTSPTSAALLLAAHPQIQHDSLLGDDAPADVEARLDAVMARSPRSTRLGAAAAHLAATVAGAGAEHAVLRQGRAIGWIEDALAPLRRSHPHVDTRRLAIAIRSATGIEALIWLTRHRRSNPRPGW